jgi:hypothetical protein
MKKNLTEKQTLIIEEITNEFVKINEQKKVRKSGALFNFGEYLNQIEEDEEAKSLIKLHNKAQFKNFVQIVDDAIDTLNNELTDYGLMAYRFNINDMKNMSLSRIPIYIDLTEFAKYNTSKKPEESFKLSEYRINIEAKAKTEYINFKSGIEGICKYIEFSHFESGYSGEKRTIEEIAKYQMVTDKLQKYIREKF